MERVEIDRKAPVVESVETTIQAPVATVWSVISNLVDWPLWNPGVSGIEVEGDVVAGTVFTWMANGTRIRSRLEEVTAPTRIVWSGRTMGIRAVHVWEFESRGAGTFVRTRESFSGAIVRLLRPMMRRTLARALEQGVSDLARAAEARA